MHKTFVIERFRGQARNQEGRITKMPDRIIGEFGRVGGITPLDGFVYAASTRGMFNYDWTGVFAGVVDNTDANSDWFVGYTQSENILSDPATVLKLSGSIVYLPGAGLVLANPTPRLNAFYVAPDGNIVVLNSPRISVVIDSTSISGGSLPADARAAVVIVYLVPAAHGLIPVAKTRGHASIRVGNAFRIEHTPPAGLPTGTIINMYVGLYANGEVIAGWDRVLSKRPDEWPGTYYLKSVNDVSTNSLPVFIGTKVDSGRPGHTTLSQARSFHAHVSASVYAVIFSDLLGPWMAITRDIPLISDHSNQYVYYSGAGYLGFNDEYTPDYAQFLRFDDDISAISPSVRGIYAFSDVGTWEAYGSFASTQDTRISLVPVLGGIDADDFLITFSGDTAYFVKDGFVHSIGPGGVKVIGKRLDDRLRKALGIFYDRFARRLYAAYSAGTNLMTVAIYDPVTDAWSELPEFPTALLPTTRVQICLLKQRRLLVGDAELAFSQSLPKTDVEFEFKKLDYDEPNTRKTTHVIEVPYLGTGIAPTASIAEAGGTPQPCNVIDRGGYYEVRCPTVVARAFDFRMRVGASGDDFAINPPLVFTYRQYGRTPDQK